MAFRAALFRPRGGFLLLAFLTFVLGGPARSETTGASPFLDRHVQTGTLLDYRQAEVNLSQTSEIPKTGWEQKPITGQRLLRDVVPYNPDKNVTAWYRVRFSRSDAGSGPLAFETDHTAERIVVYLNGVDIYRSFGVGDRFEYGWNKPRMGLLPEALLREDGNELVLRVDAAYPAALRVGDLRVGGFDAIRAAHEWRRLTRVEGPKVVNGVLAILTLAILLFWSVRPQESIFGWMGLVGVVWFARNIHYYADAPLFNNGDLFWSLTHLSLFVLMVVIYGFVAAFIELPNRRRVVGFLGLCALAILLLHIFFTDLIFGMTLSYLACIPVSLWVIWLFMRHAIVNPRLDSLVMFVAITAAFLFSVHDLGLMARTWDGAEFYLQPYGGLIVYSAFCFAVGRRVLLALTKVEGMNEELAVQVSEATRELRESEAARRQLEVSAAVEQERSRLMREIHDGIGSNLVTALAVARRQDEHGPSVGILKRSISDLKIAIDSLEPSEGDLSLVLASFRQRAQADLEQAGIALKWNVDAIPPLDWLDAPNTLHVLRIFQEVVTNVIKHAAATEIEVHCRAEFRNGLPGVLVEFSDNGVGLKGSAPAAGKGIVNMTARAEALNAQLTTGSGKNGAGTCVALWLPYRRTAAANDRMSSERASAAEATSERPRKPESLP